MAAALLLKREMTGETLGNVFRNFIKPVYPPFALMKNMLPVAL
jgi:hypothetical protein